MKKILATVIILVLLLSFIQPVFAGGGHYQPGYVNIRDFVEPPSKGFVALIYNPFYRSGEYMADNGKKLQPLTANRSVSINNAITVDATATADLNVKIFSYAINPVIFYCSDFNILGAKYAAGIAPSYNYVHARIDADVSADLSVNGTTVAAASRHIKVEDSDSGFGDLMVRPLMLDWGSDRYDIVFSYSFYAPTGSYERSKLANVGMGYWSHDLSVGGLYYFNKKATAILYNATYEFNSRISGQDTNPGQNLVLEYGVDQFLNKRLEVGVTGSSYFQTTDDSGADARNKSNREMVHSVGGEADLWLIPNKFSITGRYFYQYYAENALKGQGVNVTARILF